MLLTPCGLVSRHQGPLFINIPEKEWEECSCMVLMHKGRRECLKLSVRDYLFECE